MEQNENRKRKGALVVIDGKPPVADNTTIMLYAVKFRAVDEGIPTAYFGHGVSDKEVVHQLISIMLDTDYEHVAAGELNEREWKRLDEKLVRLKDAPLYIDDTPEQTLSELKEKIEDLVITKGVSLCVIDHMEKVITPGTEKDVHFSLKALAERMGIVVIVIKES